MNLIKFSLILFVFAVVLGCNSPREQISDDGIHFSNGVMAEQVQRQIQEIEIENMWQELLKVCQIYQGFYIGTRDDNLNPNCFSKAGEICSLTFNTDSQHYLLQERAHDIQQTACALWQPYNQKIWQHDNPPQNEECFELHAAFSQPEEIQEKYKALCNERQ